MHIQATATVLQRVTDCPTLGGQAWLNLNGIRNTNILQLQIHCRYKYTNTIESSMVSQPSEPLFYCKSVHSRVFCVTLTLCKVKCSLCSMCNILYGGFDFVQSAMFFVLYVKYVQYVQYALCLTLTAY